MRKPVFPVVFSVLLVCAVGLTILNSCGGSSSASGGGGGTPPPPLPGKIGHIVIIVQENRTPDNLFQDPVLIGRGADIVQSGMNSHGQTIALTPVLLTSGFDLDHDHGSFYLMWDNGKMDGADRIPVACLKGTTCPPNPQYTYVQPAEVQPYFQLAEQYTFGDRMFQTQQGPSFPAHQFLISGTSAPTATSTSFAAGNPNVGPAGCIGPPTEMVVMVDSSGRLSSPQYPCFEHQTVTDLLNAAKVNWKYYAPSAGSIWTGPDAIQHMCQPQTVGGTLTCTGSDWNNVIIPSQQVLTDIANHQLAQVNWVIPTGQESDHPTQNDGSGPSWVASVVNAVGNSLYWSDTAIFITWDDWGGFFDHVAPKVISDQGSWGSGFVYGFRVPLIVVSPYAKAAYISHATHDFGSILKFIEQTYNLKSLNYADALADDFSDCFDFTQTPLKFHSVDAPLKADFFINDKRPPTDPDTD